ncbi:hypothetical protein ADUPG1_001943, partial [Aduncisulcus paluster]
SPDQLTTAATQYEQGHGKGESIVEKLAAQSGMDSVSFLKAQAKLWGGTYHSMEEWEAQKRSSARYEQKLRNSEYVLDNAAEFRPDEIVRAAQEVLEKSGYSFELMGIDNVQELLNHYGIEVNVEQVEAEDR